MVLGVLFAWGVKVETVADTCGALERLMQPERDGGDYDVVVAVDSEASCDPGTGGRRTQGGGWE